VAILAFGGWLALHHEITLGTFLAFSTYIVQLVSPARQLAGVLTIGQQARAGIERIFQLLDLPPAIAMPRAPWSCPGCAGRSPPTCTSAYGSETLPFSGASTCTSAPGNGWPSSARAAAASRPWPCSSRASTTPTKERSGRRIRRPGGHPALAAAPGRRRLRRELPLLGHGAVQHRLRTSRRHR
jgi:ABC-type multidrug transport system fused ATPase/permease subunit